MANINENKEAYQMMKNALGSIENRFREAYNKGYHDGLKEGINQTTQKLVSKLLDEVEADTPQTERMAEEEIDTMLAKALMGQTNSNCSELPNDSTAEDVGKE